MQVSNAGFASPSASVCRLDEELLFLGSWTGDSLLVRTVPEVRLGNPWRLWTMTNTVVSDCPCDKRKQLCMPPMVLMMAVMGTSVVLYPVP